MFINLSLLIAKFIFIAKGHALCPLPLYARNSHRAIRNPHPVPCYLTLTILGSSVSLNPSPSKLNPSTAQAMARPGKIAIQGVKDI